MGSLSTSVQYEGKKVNQRNFPVDRKMASRCDVWCLPTDNSTDASEMQCQYEGVRGAMEKEIAALK